MVAQLSREACTSRITRGPRPRVTELRIGWVHYVLGLYRGVDDHPRQIRRLHRPRLRSNREALMDQGFELVFAHALAPACQERAIEVQLVLKEFLAAQILKIGVLHPPFAQRPHRTDRACA